MCFCFIRVPFDPTPRHTPQPRTPLSGSCVQLFLSSAVIKMGRGRDSITRISDSDGNLNFPEVRAIQKGAPRKVDHFCICLVGVDLASHWVGVHFIDTQFTFAPLLSPASGP